MRRTKIRDKKPKDYESHKRWERKRRELWKDDGCEWADFKPRRDYGIFSSTKVSTYTHNGIKRFF